MSLDLLDTNIFNSVFGLTHRSLFFDDAGVFLAKYLPYLLVFGVGTLILSARNARYRLALVSEAALTVILSRGIVAEFFRYFYEHPRPFADLGFSPLIGAEATNSFPSGHAAFFFALAPLVFSISRRAGLIYVILVSLNGLARVFVGVHWPLDIIGGAAVGILSGLIVRQLMKPYLEQLKPPHSAN